MVDRDEQEGMLMNAGGQVRDSSGRRRVGQDAARAWRGKEIGECRFKGTAGGQLRERQDRRIQVVNGEGELQKARLAHQSAADAPARRAGGGGGGRGGAGR